MDKATIGVVTVCHTYTHFAARWARSVKNLNTTPDKVVIAATDPVAVIGEVEGLIDVTVVRADPPFNYAKYLNTAIRACDTDWIAWIGLDDAYRISALDGVAFTDADVVSFGLQYSTGQAWIGRTVTPDEVLTVSENYVPCGSPFRRHLWERTPFQPDLAPFEDWAFWVGCAAQGARFKATGRTDVDYSIHPEQIVPPTEPTRTRIAEWATTLETA